MIGRRVWIGERKEKISIRTGMCCVVVRSYAIMKSKKHFPAHPILSAVFATLFGLARPVS